MGILECPTACGRPSYRVELEYYAAEAGDWIRGALLQDHNLEDSIELLQQAQQCVATMRKEA